MWLNPAGRRRAMPPRLLLVRLSHLGDVVHALPVFHALRAQHPAAEIGWVVQSEFAGILRGMPGLERLFLFERRGGARAWRALRRELALWRPDHAIDAQGNLKSAVATWMSGASLRSGLDRRDWRERAGAWLVNDRAPAASGPHAIERMQALAQHVAPDGWRSIGLRCDPALAPSELDTARSGWDALGRVDVVVHLATPGDVRSWPRERFEELLRALESRRERAWVVSGPAEAALGAEVARAHPAHAHSVGQRGLRELAALFTLASRARAPFVGCDSGPMHLAWACGMRAVVLEGPQDARRTGPWPLAEPADARHRVVRSSESLACAPCLARTCSHAQGPVCMSRIVVADVLRALNDLRSRNERAAPSGAAR